MQLTELHTALRTPALPVTLSTPPVPQQTASQGMSQAEIRRLVLELIG